jgi:zinc D-Ala-D-Ala carboxypeptidase
MPQDQRLSPNFWLSEFTRSGAAVRHGLRNEPLASHILNLKRVAVTLEQVRAYLGHKAIIISSGYRCPALNTLVRGSKYSAHMQGLAADFVCPDFGSPREICTVIADSHIAFDQLIFESNWVHLSQPATFGAGRREVLTAVFQSGQDVTYLKGLA